jgi:hypothetical protein
MELINTMDFKIMDKATALAQKTTTDFVETLNNF